MLESKEFLDALEDEIINVTLDIHHYDDESYVGYPVEHSLEVCEEYLSKLENLKAWLESRP